MQARKQLQCTPGKCKSADAIIEASILFRDYKDDIKRVWVDLIDKEEELSRLVAGRVHAKPRVTARIHIIVSRKRKGQRSWL